MKERRGSFPVPAVAWAILLLGLTARLRIARGAFLSPDEVLHLQISDAGTWAETYRASLNVAHPPLFFFLLRAWRRIAGAGWALRLLPVGCGTAFLWAGYRWAVRIAGVTAGLAALSLFALLPSFILLSSEIRAYGLLLLLLAASLVLLERALDSDGPGSMAGMGLLEALALLTHYSAVFILLPAGLYAAIRLRERRRSRRLVAVWLTTQATLVALFALLFATHISRLHGGELEREARTDWLHASYFQPGAESALRFLARQTLSLAQHVFSARWAGAAALALILAVGLILLLRRRPAALLLLLPFAACAGAGLLRLYPYGGTRHDMVLAPFACLMVAWALARLSGDRPWAAAGLAAALLPGAIALAW